MRASGRSATTLGAAVGVVLTATLLAGCGGGSGGSSAAGGHAKAGSTSITVSYSEDVADELPLWIAKDAGLFKKNGLNVKLVSLSSDQGFPALISGQTQLASIGASEMVSGAASGAKVKYLATLTPVFPYQLWSRVPAGQLKGKKIGFTSKSGSVYIATLEALKQLGLSPSDVHLVPLGSVTNVNNALIAGSIDAAVSHPPASAKFKKAHMHSVLDLAKQKIPTSNVGIAATQKYLSAHRDVVTEFLTSIKQAIQRERSDKSYAISDLSKHIGVTDQSALAQTYDFYVNEVLPKVPTPTVAQLATSQKSLKASVPGVAKLNLNDVVDPSVVQKVWGSAS